MLKCVTLVVFIACVFSAPQFDFPVPNYSIGGTPWPMPSSYNPASGSYTLDPSSFRFVATKGSSSILLSAFQRYSTLCFPSRNKMVEGNATLNQLAVAVQTISQSDRISFTTDESYSLQISDSGATLTANTVFGALRGLETFSQLIIKNGNSFSINFVNIQDKPRFPWRGLLLDTSRHFLSVTTIKRTIQAMSYNKLNVLHWHIVDGQSFPYQSTTFPLLSQRGAYHPDAVYTQAHIADLIAYANSYGVRVVPEFDMPGHATSWGFGYPYLIMNCSKQQNENDFNDGWADQPMDPTNPNVYDFIGKFIKEISQVFPDEFIHLGGDEVPFNCWNVTRINDWMKQNNIPSYAALESHFINQVFNIIKGYGKQYLYWEEVFENTSPSKTGVIIDVWKSFTEMAAVTAAGYNAILSHGWYLDDLNESWQTFYGVEPTTGIPASQTSLIKGGEISSWGESVDDSNSDTRLWPRTAAAAERLWSPITVNDPNKALTRYLQQRCRMIKRGISAGPDQPGPGCY